MRESGKVSIHYKPKTHFIAKGYIMSKQQLTVKQRLRLAFRSDSDRLFRAVWRRILKFGEQCEIDDLYGLYDSICSRLVNDSKSVFYMYG